MNTSGFIARLNRRNKVALCATLVYVGIILLQDGGIRLAVGIAFLGVAYSWALGTNRRISHWLFLILGLLLLVPAVLDGHEWPQKKLKLIEMNNTNIEAEKFIVQNDDRKNFVADEENLQRDKRELRNLQAEGVFDRVIEHELGPVAGGLLLVGSGFGLLVGIKHAAPSGELPNLEKQVRGHHVT